VPLYRKIGPLNPDGTGLRIEFSHPHPTALRPQIVTLDRLDVPGSVRNGTLSEIEVWVDQWLQDRLSVVVAIPDDPLNGQRVWEAYAKSHVRSKNPFLIDVTISNSPIP